MENINKTLLEWIKSHPSNRIQVEDMDLWIAKDLEDTQLLADCWTKYNIYQLNHDNGKWHAEMTGRPIEHSLYQLSENIDSWENSDVEELVSVVCRSQDTPEQQFIDTDNFLDGVDGSESEKIGVVSNIINALLHKKSTDTLVYWWGGTEACSKDCRTYGNAELINEQVLQWQSTQQGDFYIAIQPKETYVKSIK